MLIESIEGNFEQLREYLYQQPKYIEILFGQVVDAIKQSEFQNFDKIENKKIDGVANRDELREFEVYTSGIAALREQGDLSKLKGYCLRKGIKYPDSLKMKEVEKNAYMLFTEETQDNLSIN